MKDAILQSRLPAIRPRLVRALAGSGIVAIVGLVVGAVIGVLAAFLSILVCSDPPNHVYAGRVQCLFYFPAFSLTLFAFAYEWFVALVARSFGERRIVYAVAYVVVLLSFSWNGLGILTLVQLHVAYHGCAILGLGFIALPIAFLVRMSFIRLSARSRTAAFASAFAAVLLLGFLLTVAGNNPLPLLAVSELAALAFAASMMLGVLTVIAILLLRMVRS
jgi:hypothetical protein